MEGITMTAPTPEAPTTDPTAGADPKATEQGDPAGDKPLGENGEKALKAERERAAKAEKAAADLQKQLDAINEANLSELDKAKKAATDAQALALQAGTEALRYRIAAETGITENVDLILTAPDEDTMRRQAALWGARADTTTTAGPRPDLSQGGNGGAAPSSEQAAADWLRNLTRS